MILQVLFPENFCLAITVCDLWIKVAIGEFGGGEVNVEGRGIMALYEQVMCESTYCRCCRVLLSFTSRQMWDMTWSLSLLCPMLKIQSVVRGIKRRL